MLLILGGVVCLAVGLAHHAYAAHRASPGPRAGSDERAEPPEPPTDGQRGHK